VTLPTITPQLWESGLSAVRQIDSYLILFLCEKGRAKYQKKSRVQPLFREFEKFFFSGQKIPKTGSFCAVWPSAWLSGTKKVKIDPGKRLAKRKKTPNPIEN
jgi:hypothetical protein